MKKQLKKIFTRIAIFLGIATYGTAAVASQSQLVKTDYDKQVLCRTTEQRHKVAANLYEILKTLPADLIWIITDYLKFMPNSDQVLQPPVLVQELLDHKDRVNTLSPLSDRKSASPRFASGSDDGTVRIFTRDNALWTETAKLQHYDEQITAIAPLNDRELVSGTAKGTLTLWNFGTKEATQSLINTTGKIVALARLNENAFACAMAPSNSTPTLTLWRRETKDKKKMPFKKSAPLILSIAPTCLTALANDELVNDKLACGLANGKIKLYQYTEGRLKHLRELQIPNNEQEQKHNHAAIVALQAGEKPNQLFAVSSDGNIGLLDTEGKRATAMDTVDSKSYKPWPGSTTSGVLLPGNIIATTTAYTNKLGHPYNIALARLPKTMTALKDDLTEVTICEGAHDVEITSITFVGGQLITSSSEPNKWENEEAERIKVWEFPCPDILPEKSGCIIA